jgi:gluconokinase
VSGDSSHAIVIMGVAGCGKSTVGRALAEYLACPFVEGDDFHSEENVRKMQNGIALDDADRAPWLDAIEAELAKPGLKVAACSALKRSYRARLAQGVPIVFAHLNITPKVARLRTGQRNAHFWPSALLTSQFDILEPPELAEAGAKCFDGGRPVDKLVKEIADWATEVRNKNARNESELRTL